MKHRQIAFNRAWDHFVVKKGPQAIGRAPNGTASPAKVMMCVYRGNDDPTSPIRCAVGVSIPDEKYRVEMEGKDVQWILDNYPDVLPEFEKDSMFLKELQRCHDDIGSPDYPQEHEEFLRRIEENLRRFAGLYALQIPSV